MQKFLMNGKGSDNMATARQITSRINILKQMNQYIINIGDEEIWMDWIAVGVPDEATEDDYLFMAEDDKIWRETCEIFDELRQRAEEEE